MNKAILVGLAILTVSTSGASAWTHRSHRGLAMKPNAPAVAMNPTPYARPTNAYVGVGPYYTPQTNAYAAAGPYYYRPPTNAYVGMGPYYAPQANAYAAAGPYYRPPTNAYAAVRPDARPTATLRPRSRPTSAYAAAGAPPPVSPGVSSKDHEMYMKNLHDSGYDPKKDYTSAGIMRQQ